MSDEVTDAYENASGRRMALGPNEAAEVNPNGDHERTVEDLEAEVRNLKRVIHLQDELLRKRAKPDSPRTPKFGELPSFSGKASEFFSWRNSLDHLVLKADYSANMKFEAIKRTTAGLPDLRHLQAWPGTEEDIQRALELVERWYGSQDAAIQELRRDLISMKPVQRSDAAGLKRLLVNFNMLIETATRMGKLEPMRQSLCDITICRMPPDMKAEAYKLAEEDRTIAKLQEMLDKQVMAELSREATEERNASYYSRSSTTSFRSTTGHTWSCPFDGQSHPLRACPTSVDERWRIVAERQLCQQCLRPGHQMKVCRVFKNCAVCQERHHGFLCKQYVKPSRHEKASEEHTNLRVATTDTTRYKTFVCPINRDWCRVLVDEAAGCSFILESTVKRLGLPVYDGAIMNIFGSTTDRPMRSHEYGSIRTDFANSPLVCCVVQSLHLRPYSAVPLEVLKHLPEPVKRLYNDNPTRPIEVVIGLQNAQEASLGELKCFYRTEAALYSYQTLNNHVVVVGGPRLELSTTIRVARPEADLLEEVERSTEIPEDDYVDKFLEDNVRMINGRVEVRVPTIGKISIESNEDKCRHRLRRNLSRWEKSGLLNVVQAIFEEWKEAGIIEPADPSQPGGHYLAYHIVSKPQSNTTKHRAVFNGSLVDKHGKSINDMLFKGHTTWNLTRSLSNFRKHPYPLLGDLRKAFLMVSLDERDRDWFRFLWPESGLSTPYRFARVPFGTSASPFLLYLALRKIALCIDTQLCGPEEFVDFFYVDDIVTSFSSLDRRDSVQAMLTRVLRLYGFEINWKTEPYTSVLGLEWNRHTDCLSIKVPDLPTPRTIRNLASLIPTLFDPMGWIEPVTGALRREFSKLWRCHKQWDYELSEEERNDIDHILQWIPKEQPLELARTAGTNTVDVVYQVFADANDQAIGVVVYREQTEARPMMLITAKSVLHRQRTIPEAELDALVLAAKIVVKHIPPEHTRVILWTDSNINVHRFRAPTVNSLRYQQARKVMLIRGMLEPYEATLQHLPGTQNPADWLTKFRPRRFYWSSWIARPPSAVTEESVSLNVRQTAARSCLIDPQVIEQAESLSELTSKYDLKDCIAIAQEQEWKDELNTLRRGDPITRSSSLGPYYYSLYQGLLSTRLRLSDGKPRIMIPKESRLLELLLQHIHEDRAHAGIGTMRKLFSNEYFTFGLTRALNRVVHGCTTCLRLRGQTLQHSPGMMSAEQCTVPKYAFDRIGIDFTGPLTAGTTQYYILVVACLNSRNLFLKMLTEQTAHGTVCALQQLASTYGRPSYVYSDNAAVFKRSERILRTLYEGLPDVCAELKWHYSFAGGPQSNGVTETMVKLTKQGLKGLAFNKHCSGLELEVFLAEVARIVNSRPLFRHQGTWITPQHLLFGRTVDPIPVPTEHGTTKSLIQIYQTIRKRVNGFWRTWKTEYLSTLRHLQLKRTPCEVKEGQSVLYEPYSKTSKSDWPTGIITKVYPGADGQVRLVDLRLDSGDVLTNRPVTRLILCPAEDGASAQASPARRAT